MNFRHISILLLCCTAVVALLLLPTTESAISSLKCHTLKSPNDCKKLSPPSDCTFCFDGCLKPGQPRCDSPRTLRRAGCRSFNLGPSANYSAVILTGSTPANCSLWVPVATGRRRNVSVTFESRRGYPLDFYYLMDTTGSMTPQKDALISLSSQLLQALKERSTDFRIGFGTFKDKPPPGPGAATDYSFRNNMPLTDASDRFVDRVREAEIRGGGDDPESHGDALAQVAECTDQVGWRKSAQHVILVVTDVAFHVAGDGASGISAPYIPGCYLNAAGYYSEQTSMDYPSVEQLAVAMANKSITTIFASASSTELFYTAVTQVIKPSTFGVLEGAGNVVKLVIDEFTKLGSRMEIERVGTGAGKAGTGLVKLRYFSNCLGGPMKETAICEHLPFDGGKITFVVEVELPSCPVGGEREVKLKLRPVGLPSMPEITLGFMC